MKNYIAILIFSVFVLSNINLSAKVATMKYAGKYKYGSNTNAGTVKEAVVYPETDSTVIVYVNIVTQAPAYNMGDILVRMKLTEGKGSFLRIDAVDESHNDTCAFEIEFRDKNLFIKAHDNCECGFGHNVYIDGPYKRISTKIPEYYTNVLGEKVLFKNSEPEN